MNHAEAGARPRDSGRERVFQFFRSHEVRDGLRRNEGSLRHCSTYKQLLLELEQEGVLIGRRHVLTWRALFELLEQSETDDYIRVYIWRETTPEHRAGDYELVVTLDSFDYVLIMWRQILNARHEKWGVRYVQDCHALPVVAAEESVDEQAMLASIRRCEDEGRDLAPEHEQFLREREAREDARRANAHDEDPAPGASGSSRSADSCRPFTRSVAQQQKLLLKTGSMTGTVTLVDAQTDRALEPTFIRANANLLQPPEWDRYQRLGMRWDLAGSRFVVERNPLNVLDTSYTPGDCLGETPIHSVTCTPNAHVTVVKTLLREDSQAPEGRTLVDAWVGGVPGKDQNSRKSARDDTSAKCTAETSVEVPYDTGIEDLSTGMGSLSLDDRAGPPAYEMVGYNRQQPPPPYPDNESLCNPMAGVQPHARGGRLPSHSTPYHPVAEMSLQSGQRSNHDRSDDDLRSRGTLSQGVLDDTVLRRADIESPRTERTDQRDERMASGSQTSLTGNLPPRSDQGNGQLVPPNLTAERIVSEELRMREGSIPSTSQVQTMSTMVPPTSQSERQNAATNSGDRRDREASAYSAGTHQGTSGSQAARTPEERIWIAPFPLPVDDSGEQPCQRPPDAQDLTATDLEREMKSRLYPVLLEFSEDYVCGRVTPAGARAMLGTTRLLLEQCVNQAGKNHLRATWLPIVHDVWSRIFGIRYLCPIDVNVNAPGMFGTNEHRSQHSVPDSNRGVHAATQLEPTAGVRDHVANEPREPHPPRVPRVVPTAGVSGTVGNPPRPLSASIENDERASGMVHGNQLRGTNPGLGFGDTPPQVRRGYPDAAPPPELGRERNNPQYRPGVVGQGQPTPQRVHVQSTPEHARVERVRAQPTADEMTSTIEETESAIREMQNQIIFLQNQVDRERRINAARLAAPRVAPAQNAPRPPVLSATQNVPPATAQNYSELCELLRAQIRSNERQREREHSDYLRNCTRQLNLTQQQQNTTMAGTLGGTGMRVTDIMKNIQPFSDNKGKLRWTDWLVSFQQTMEDNDVEKPLWGKLLAQKLDGRAKREQSGMDPSTRLNYDLVTAKLDRVFNSEADRHVALHSMKARKQLPSETARDFANALSDLARKAFPRDLDEREKRIKEQFRDGLGDVPLYSRMVDYEDKHPEYLFQDLVDHLSRHDSRDVVVRTHMEGTEQSETRDYVVLPDYSQLSVVYDQAWNEYQILFSATTKGPQNQPANEGSAGKKNAKTKGKGETPEVSSTRPFLKRFEPHRSAAIGREPVQIRDLDRILREIVRVLDEIRKLKLQRGENPAAPTTAAVLPGFHGLCVSCGNYENITGKCVLGVQHICSRCAKTQRAFGCKTCMACRVTGLVDATFHRDADPTFYIFRGPSCEGMYGCASGDLQEN